MLQTAQHVQRTVCFRPCYDVYAFCSVSALRRFESRRAAKDVFRLQQAWATDADALVMISPLRWGEHRVRIQDETKWSKYLWNCVYIYIYIHFVLFHFIILFHVVSHKYLEQWSPHQGHQLCHWQQYVWSLVISCKHMQTLPEAAAGIYLLLRRGWTPKSSELQRIRLYGKLRKWMLY